jgi:hypothetical protein
MTITYLAQSQSTMLDGSGNGIITFTPAVGQYWAITLIRVATISQNIPYPYCAVYQGPIGQFTPSFFVDSTYTGQSDSSSMMSGTLTAFGNAVTVQWTNGTPGDTATATIFGVSSDVPPTVDDFVPAVAGIHFAGQLIPVIKTDLLNTVFTASAGTSNPLETLTMTLPGYRIYVTLQWNSAPVNGLNAIVFLQWVDPLTQELISRQEWNVGAAQSGGGDSLRLSGTGPIEAGSLIVGIQNEDSSSGITAMIVVSETTSQYARHDLRYQNFNDVTIPGYNSGTEPGPYSDILFSLSNVTIPVNTTRGYLASLYSGMAQLLVNQDQVTPDAGLSVYVSWGIPALYGTALSSVVFGAGNPVNLMLILPRAPAFVIFSNGSATAAPQVTASLTALER